ARVGEVARRRAHGVDGAHGVAVGAERALRLLLARLVRRIAAGGDRGPVLEALDRRVLERERQVGVAAVAAEDTRLRTRRPRGVAHGAGGELEADGQRADAGAHQRRAVVACRKWTAEVARLRRARHAVVGAAL